jgi:hypothetical protein
MIGGGLIAGRYWMLKTGYRFRLHHRVSDRAGVLPFDDRENFESYLDRIYEESGVDIRFLFVPSVQGESLAVYSVRQARAMGLGRETGRRGLLFVYDVADQRLRVEVGAKLEGVFPDGFIGYLSRNHVRNFFSGGDPAIGMYTTLLIVHNRIRQAVLGQEYDPRFVEYIEDIRRLAVGGGATSAVPLNTGGREFLNRRGGHDERLHFVPQPTVEQAYQRYLEWLALGTYQYDLPLFTNQSQGWLSSLAMTRVFRDFMLAKEYGRHYEVDERGQFALAYCTDDPLADPHFFRKSPDGWQVDIVAEVLGKRNYAGGPYAWGLTDYDDEYSNSFANRYVSAYGVLRINGGDNRALPTFDTKWDVASDAIPVATSPIPMVEQMDVQQAVERIATHRGRPMIVTLFHYGNSHGKIFFPRLVRLAKEYAPKGLEVVAFSVDKDRCLRCVTRAFENDPAPFPALRILPWESGQLGAGMRTIGISVGTVWAAPLVAVIDRDGRVIAQGQHVGDPRDFEAAIKEAIR